MDRIGKNSKKLFENLEKVRQENNDLKQLITNLSEAATASRDREMTWVYALEGNRDGVWDWNAVTNEVYFSKRWKEMLGFQENEISNHLSEWDKRVHPDDRDAVYADLNRHLNGETSYYQNEHRVQCKDGFYKWILDRGKIISWTKEGKPLRIVGTHTDVTLRKQTEIENQKLLIKLSEALDNVKILKGLLPICAMCKKIRDDKGHWNPIEIYIKERSEAKFSHGICPECARSLFPDYVDDN